MEDRKKPKRRIVKYLTILTMIISLISVCSLPIFANSVNERVNVEYLCGGSPLNMTYVTTKPEGSAILTYTGYAPAINQYVIDTGADTPAPSYSYGLLDSRDFNIAYNRINSGVANQVIGFSQPTLAPQWSTNTPCVARNYGDINQKGYNLYLAVYQPHSILEDWTPYVYASIVNVRHVYNVTYNELLPDGSTSPRYLNVFRDAQYPVDEDGWARIPLYAQDAFQREFFDQYASFTYNEENYACINSATILLIEGENPVREGVYSRSYYIEPLLDTLPSISLAEYQRRYREDLSIIGDTDQINVQFNDVTFTDWIKRAVGGFMNFEIVPGISFAGILAVLLGVPLLIWFLKLFAGG